MKSLLEIKDEVAQKYGHANFAAVKNKYRKETLHIGDLIAFVNQANEIFYNQKESNMEKGQKVRVIDNGKLAITQISQLGKKGKIKTVQAGKGAYVVFKSGSALWFSSDQMELVKPKQPKYKVGYHIEGVGTITSIKKSEPKLLPFNLEEALAGKPVVTRDGTPIVKFYQDGDSRLVNFPYRGTDGQATHEYTGRGTYHEDGKKDHRDLFMKPEPKKKKTAYWINIYQNRDTKHFYAGQLFTRKEAADELSQAGLVKTIKIKL